MDDTQEKVLMINSHALELLHTCPIKLKKNERVVMMCNYGCELDIGVLFREFIYKHLTKAKNFNSLVKLLRNPVSKGKKYKKLYFLERLLCMYKDLIPDMELDFNYDPYFRSGVNELPIKTSKRVEWSQLADPDDFSFHFESVFYIPAGIIRLSEFIKVIRHEYPHGFTLLLFGCRTFKSDVENVQLQHIKLNKK